jgi:hypothetical protein
VKTVTNFFDTFLLTFRGSRVGCGHANEPTQPSNHYQVIMRQITVNHITYAIAYRLPADQWRTFERELRKHIKAHGLGPFGRGEFMGCFIWIK